MTRLSFIAALLLVGLLRLSTIEAASYYFSAAGDDVWGDGSMERPWNSVARFNALQLRPGDGAYFRSGDTFNGTVRLDSADSAVDAHGRLIAPISIGSYGGGKATIQSPFNAEGMVVHNAGGIELSDLDFLSGGFTNAGRTNGVQFMVDIATTSSRSKLEHIRISNVTARNFGLNGLQVWAHQTVGFDDVQVTDSEFSGNGYSGMYLGASQYTLKPHANVTVDRVIAHNNPGYVGSLPITGHGVIMANVDGGLLQNSVAYDNGKVNGNLNVGLWTYQSNAVTIQHNLAYGNRSPGGYDGGAFDIDGGTTNSVVQYNVSYDNDGAGLLLAEYQPHVAMGQNVFRYNLSVNDGRDGYGGITIVGNPTANASTGQIGWAQNAVFHNNTIVTDKAVVPNAKGAVYVWNEHYRNIDFFDNAFVALNGAALIAGDVKRSQADLIGNAYWTNGSPVWLEGSKWSSVDYWSSFSQLERVNGQFMGLTSNPLWSDSEHFRPAVNSPLVDHLGEALPAWWPSWLTSRGPHDLVGTSLGQGNGIDVGAWEHLAGDYDYDGDVDAEDYLLLRGQWDIAAYTIWRDNLGILNMGASRTMFQIPEPPAVMLSLTLLGMIACRANYVGRRQR